MSGKENVSTEASVCLRAKTHKHQRGGGTREGAGQKKKKINW